MIESKQKIKLKYPMINRSCALIQDCLLNMEQIFIQINRQKKQKYSYYCLCFCRAEM